MKKYKWNKKKFINNIKIVLAFISLAILFDLMVIYVIYR